MLVSWEAIREQAGDVLPRCCCCWSTGMLGVFAARDIILFYVFFEFTLIPLFFLIGIWGQRRAALRGDQVLPLHAGRQRADVPGPAGDRAVGLLPLGRRRDDVLDSRS